MKTIFPKIIIIDSEEKLLQHFGKPYVEREGAIIKPKPFLVRAILPKKDRK